MPHTKTPVPTERVELLASRLNTLLDAAEARRGTPVTFAEIAAFLEGRGIALSRARWSYMVNGHRLVDDTRLLDALSDFFDVPAGYLRGDEEAPEQLAAQLDLVRAMRVAQVRSFAARALGELSPETLRMITSVLDGEELARPGD